MKKMDLLAFVHIEKSAGTSMIHLLRHNYCLRYLDVRPLGHKEKIFKAEDLVGYIKLAPWLRAIGGHSVVPWSNLNAIANVRYVTLLRDPVKRYVSQYRYWNSHLGKSISMEEYLSKEGPRNIQVKKLAGEANLNRAMDNIDDKFACVGVVEHLDAFLRECQNSEMDNGFKALRIERNVNKHAAISADNIVDQYEDEIRENNRLDLELYEKILKNIEEQLMSEGNASSSIPDIKRSPQLAFDYIFRKFYVEPVTGWLRTRSGLEKSGSY